MIRTIKQMVLVFAMLLSSSHFLKAQSEPEKGPGTTLRTSQVTAGGTTYNYDVAGNRIKRIYTGGGGCINTWTGNVSASWNTPGNWSLGVVPQPCHTVVIPTLSGKPYPNLDINATIASIEFTGGNLNANNFNLSFNFDPGCATLCP